MLWRKQYFSAVLDLQKLLMWLQRVLLACTQFPLSVTFYMSLVHLQQLLNQSWHIIISLKSMLYSVFLSFYLMSFVYKSYSKWVFCKYFLLVSGLSFHIFSYLCVFTSAHTSIWNGVLVQDAVTEYHRLSSLNNTHIFLTVLEAGSLTIRVSVWRGSWCEPSSRFTESRCIAMSSCGQCPQQWSQL